MSPRTPDDGTVTVGPDDAQVAFRRTYPTPPGDLWTAVTDPRRARRWLGALHGDLRVGGEYELRMGEDRADADDVARGRVLVCEPPHLLEVTWLFPGEGESHVRVTLAQDDGTSILDVVHTRLDVAAAPGYGGGWHVVLDQLDDHCSGRPVRAWDELYEDRRARYTDAG